LQFKKFMFRVSSNNPRKVTHRDSDYYNKAKIWYYSNHDKILQKLISLVIQGVIVNAKNYHGMVKAKFKGKDHQ